MQPFPALQQSGPRLVALACLLALGACDSNNGKDGSSGGSGGATSGGGSGGGDGPGSGGNDSGAGGGAGATGGGSNSGGGCEGAILCEDFEAYGDTGAPGGPWSVRVSDGQVTMDTERAFSGTKSVKVSAAGSGGRVAFLVLDGAPAFPVAGNHFFGRMRFWLDSAPTTSVNWTFIEAEGLVPGQTYRAQYRYGGQHAVTDGATFLGSQLMANYETPDSYGGNGPSSDCWQHSDSVVVPMGAWACAEWEFDGPNDTMRFWLDGQLIDSATVEGTGQGCGSQLASTWTAPTFQKLHLGWQAYQPDDERTLWIDDVALATERLGCEP